MQKSESKQLYTIPVIQGGQTNVHPMVRAMLGAMELIFLIECTKARAERCQEMATEKNTTQFTTHTNTLEENEVAAQEFDMVRSKILNCQSVGLVLIVNLKKK